jgi:hypothetical protein
MLVSEYSCILTVSNCTHSFLYSPGTSTDLIVRSLALGPAPAPVILIQSPPPPVPRTRLARLAAFARYSLCGPSDPPLDFHWDVLAPADPAAPAGVPAAAAVSVLSAEGPTLEFARAAAIKLSAGRTYRVRVSARLRGFAGGPAVASAEAPLALALEPTSVSVGGGDRTVGRTARVALDAFASVDPNACSALDFGALTPPPAACSAGAGGLSFAWACATGPSGAAGAALVPCRLNNGSLLALPAAAAAAVDVGMLALGAAYPADVVLKVTATAAGGAPPGTATATLRVVDAGAMVAAELRTFYANAEGVAYFASAAPGSNVTYRWSLAPAAAGDGSAVSMSDATTFPAGSTGPAFLVRLGTPWARAGLARGVTYRATVTVTLPADGGGGGTAAATLWADFTLGAGPARGACRLLGSESAPEYVRPVVTECGGWVADELPLSYSFAVIDTSAAAAAASTAAAAGRSGVPVTASSVLDDGAMWAPWSFTGR